MPKFKFNMPTQFKGNIHYTGAEITVQEGADAETLRKMGVPEVDAPQASPPETAKTDTTKK